MVYYCSKNCQGKAWLSYHSQECKIHLKVQEHHSVDQIMSIEGSTPLYTALYLFRIYLKQKLQPDEFFELPNGKKRYFSDLISHTDEIMKNTKKMELFGHIYSVYQKCLPDSQLPSYSLMLDIYGKSIINTQEVSVLKLKKNNLIFNYSIRIRFKLDSDLIRTQS